MFVSSFHYFINSNFYVKNSILPTLVIFIYMKPRKKEEDKRVKISITLSPLLNHRMEKETINKSKLIEKLLIEYYGKKDMYQM